MTFHWDRDTTPWIDKGSITWPNIPSVINLMSESVKRVITPTCTGTTMPVKVEDGDCARSGESVGVSRPTTSWAYTEGRRDVGKNHQPHLGAMKDERVRRWVEDSNRRVPGQDSLEDVRHVWAAAQGCVSGLLNNTGVAGRVPPAAALGAPPQDSKVGQITSGRADQLDHLSGRLPHPLNLSSPVRTGASFGATSDLTTGSMTYREQLNANYLSEQLLQDSKHSLASHLPARLAGSPAGTFHVDPSSSQPRSLSASPGAALTSPSSPSNLSSESDPTGRELLRKRILQRNPDAQHFHPTEIKTEQLTPDEELRRYRRRQRNKEAAQRCRARRTALSQRLFKECQDLECSNTNLKYQLRQLEKEHEQLTDILQSHVKNCRLKTAGESPMTSKA